MSERSIQTEAQPSAADIRGRVEATIAWREASTAGEAIAAALEIGGRPEYAGKNIVIIIPSFAERYLSTPLFEGLG